ncbi:tetratricopeptide repeat protein [Tahibacter sp.]|uniref:tetratricopeptide repeat protein n=1 Tax=Tahibacter sp. TaxID=2056211 RepID=UPI0028C44241|nr:tetratricopeptide repeat protein [Tahibacter sp.]
MSRVLRLAGLALACIGMATLAADPVASDAPARCRSLQQPQPQQAIVACEEAYAALDPLRDAEIAEEMLFRRSDAQIATGDFAGAAATLNRVAAMPVEAGRWMHDFRLARRRGILAYRQEHYADALPLFRIARELALAHADDTALAQSWNDLGNTLRRIGDYREALNAYLASLELKRRVRDPQLGALFNNLGDLYRDLGDYAEAQRRYVEALAEHDRDERPRDAAHTRESLAAVLVKVGDTQGAGAAYAQAIATFRTLDARADELRAQVGAAALALDTQAIPAARAALARALQLAQELAQAQPPNLALQLARLRRIDGDLAGARSVLADVLARLPPDAVERAPLLQASADAAMAAGETAQAYRLQQAFHEADARLRDAAHDRRLEQLRVQFDVAERQRAIENLEAQNRLGALALRQRTTQLQLGLACAVVVLLLLAGAFLRARQRSQLAAAVRESKLAAEMEQYRRTAASLRVDGERVQALLDRSDAALLAIDAAGTLVALTRAAADLLGQARDTALGSRMAGFLDERSQVALQSALAELDDDDAVAELALRLPTATVWARLSALPSDAGIAVLQLVAGDAATVDGDAASPPTLDAAELVDATAVETDGFRRELVELMVYAVELWERVSGRTRIDLAEKSRVWRVTIDEGRLRVRAMERYLSLSRLPRQPRWREVLRTAYFVLSECRLEATERDALRTRAETVQASLRRRALV